MSVFTYNSVSFAWLKTDEYIQTAVRDPSGTDMLYTQHSIRVSGILTAGVLPGQNAAGGTRSETPSEIERRVTHLLMRPRCSLTYEGPDGKQLLSVDGKGDDNNGPVPQSCKVEHILEGSYHVKFHIVVCLAECDGAPDRDYLSNRWGETVTIDENWLTTRRRTGLLIVSSRKGNDPDSLRGVVSPGVPEGFRRVSSRYTLDKDRLHYLYEFEDKELVRLPPAPSLRMRGEQIESTPMQGGLRYGEVRIRLDGPKGISPKELLDSAIRVAGTRAIKSGALRSKSSNRLLIGGSFSESLNDDENSVTVRLTYQMEPVKSREDGTSIARATASGAATGAKIIGQAATGNIEAAIESLRKFVVDAAAKVKATEPRNSEGQNVAALAVRSDWVGSEIAGAYPSSAALAPPVRGTAYEVHLVAAALNDPCGKTTPTLTGDTSSNSMVAGTTSVTTMSSDEFELVVDDLLGDDEEAEFGDDGTDGVYNFYRVASHHSGDEGLRVFASTKAGEPGRKVRMHNPTGGLRVEWSASKTGGPPVIPAREPPENVPGKPVLIRWSKTPTQFDVAGDGVSIIQTISGIYEYQFEEPDKADITAPIPPYLNLKSLDQPARVAGQSLSNDIVWRSGVPGPNDTQDGELTGGPPPGLPPVNP